MNGQRGHPVRAIIELVEKVQDASLSHTVLHVTESFTKDPTGALGVLTCFVTAPDNVIEELHHTVSETLQRALISHGYS